MTGLVNKLKQHLPDSAKSVLRPAYRLLRHSFTGKWLASHLLYRELKRNYLYDARRYLRSSFGRRQDQAQSSLCAEIIMTAHCIEKGLSHPTPRLHFGQRHIDRLLSDLAIYMPRFGHDAITAIGLDVLTAYLLFHKQQGVELDKLDSSLKKLWPEPLGNFCPGNAGGSVAITREEIQTPGKIDVEPFLRSRHSIRHFDDRPVDESLIQQAVALAITTPSVCNRQMWKVRAYRDPNRKRAILRLQNGNRGFTEEIDTVLIVTCDLQSFFAIGERNEAWIDGGMFSMTLLLALHSLGLGACCLNWSERREKDLQLRALIGLPDEEIVLVLIAVGHIPERLSVARSARKSVEDVLIWG